MYIYIEIYRRIDGTYGGRDDGGQQAMRDDTCNGRRCTIHVAMVPWYRLDDTAACIRHCDNGKWQAHGRKWKEATITRIVCVANTTKLGGVHCIGRPMCSDCCGGCRNRDDNVMATDPWRPSSTMSSPSSQWTTSSNRHVCRAPMGRSPRRCHSLHRQRHCSRRRYGPGAGVSPSRSCPMP